LIVGQRPGERLAEELSLLDERSDLGTKSSAGECGALPSQTLHKVIIGQDEFARHASAIVQLTQRIGWGIRADAGHRVRGAFFRGPRAILSNNER